MLRLVRGRLAGGDAPAQAEDQELAARVARLDREDARLPDAYQAEVVTPDELAHRRARLAE